MSETVVIEGKCANTIIRRIDSLDPERLEEKVESGFRGDLKTSRIYPTDSGLEAYEQELKLIDIGFY